MVRLIIALIGHRGVGKTTLLRVFARDNPGWQTWDLDEEIQHSTGESVDVLVRRSLIEFRNHEARVFASLITRSTQPTLIAVGAGFEGPWPEGVHRVWVRRVTDAAGRVFLDRPALQPELSPYLEYLKLFPSRDVRYRALATEELSLPEGGGEVMAPFLRPDWVCDQVCDLTLKPENFRAWPAFWNKRARWHVRYFEVRDDLLSRAQIAAARATIPPERLLFSCRTSESRPEGQVDWALELGRPEFVPHVLSLHERESAFTDILRQFTKTPARIHKLALEIRDFYELERAHQWWLEAPTERAFLPRSSDGRWRWYRSLFGPRMPLHYIREGDGTSADQPWLWQTVLQPALQTSFAAVLGDPIDHSLSPQTHRAFFTRQGLPFVGIRVREEEFQDAMPVLERLGLRFAAVTAPLKRVAAQACAHLSPEAEALRSVNTLARTTRGWEGHNTDVIALARIARDLPVDYKQFWLWGGGGVKSSVKRVWPEAREIYARAGLSAASVGASQPDVLIWATGRSRPFSFPPPELTPKLILDLNYGPDSPGLELARARGLPYESGLNMFRLQADAQQAYWSQR